VGRVGLVHFLGGALLLAALIAGIRLRIPVVAAAGVIAVAGLIGWLGSRITRLRGAGIAAAGLFASMPLVLLQARAQTVATWLVVTGWLVVMERFSRTRDWRWLAAAAVILGLGTGISGLAFVVMPALALGTGIILLFVVEPPPSAGSLLLAAAAGLIAVLPLALYVLLHPEWLTVRVTAHGLYDAQRFNPLQGLREITSWVGLTARSETYWHYLDPAFLFISGSVFLAPAAVLLPLGAARAVVAPRLISALALMGFAVAPLAGALLVRGPLPSRAIVAAPVAAVLMTCALAFLRNGGRWRRCTAYALLVAMVVGTTLFAWTATPLVP